MIFSSSSSVSFRLSGQLIFNSVRLCEKIDPEFTSASDWLTREGSSLLTASRRSMLLFQEGARQRDEEERKASGSSSSSSLSDSKRTSLKRAKEDSDADRNGDDSGQDGEEAEGGLDGDSYEADQHDTLADFHSTTQFHPAAFKVQSSQHPHLSLSLCMCLDPPSLCIEQHPDSLGGEENSAVVATYGGRWRDRSGRCISCLMCWDLRVCLRVCIASV